jgi:carboxymethylenebutenolidase
MNLPAHVGRSSAPRLATLLLLGLPALACGPSGEPATGEAPDTAAAAETAQARIPVDPTVEGELPAAILGEAPPPRGRDLRYVPGDTLTRGYLALPEGEGPFPAVVLIHEWDGLKDRVRQVADAMAQEGYVALAADLFQGRTGSNPQENRALVGEVNENPQRMIANLDAAQAFLRDRTDVSGRVGAMGWCFGGGIALSYGLGGAEHEGTAIFYGSLLADPDSLARLDHEVYGTFAELDGGIPPSEVEAFVAALDEAGIPNDVHVYDAVDHGFWLRVDGDPETRRGPALDAWERLKGYLGRVLGP